MTKSIKSKSTKEKEKEGEGCSHFGRHTHTHIHSFTHPLTHSLIRSLVFLYTYLYIPPTHTHTTHYHAHADQRTGNGIFWRNPRWSINVTIGSLSGGCVGCTTKREATNVDLHRPLFSPSPSQTFHHQRTRSRVEVATSYLFPSRASTLVLWRLCSSLATQLAIVSTQDFFREKYPLYRFHCVLMDDDDTILNPVFFLLFKHCPLLKQWAHQHERAYADFMQYRFRIPVCGAILLNENLDKCVLVKGWSSKSGWSFPRGKINQDEEYDHCAIREVLFFIIGLGSKDMTHSLCLGRWWKKQAMIFHLWFGIRISNARFVSSPSDCILFVVCQKIPSLCHRRERKLVYVYWE